MEWLLGDVVRVRGHAGRDADAAVDVEDVAYALLEHAGGARSAVFATVANVIDSPVTIEIVAERATLRIRGDLSVTYADGRVETVAEPLPAGAGRAYWGASHELLIADFYRTLAGPEPFWIGPREGTSSLRLVHEIYQQKG
jgi:predicted dehydrogenase